MKKKTKTQKYTIGYARSQVRFWVKLLFQLQKEENMQLLSDLKTLNVSIKDIDQDEQVSNNSNDISTKVSENEEKTSEIIFPQRATVLDIPPYDTLVELQPAQIQRDKPPSFFNLFCWVRKNLRLDPQRDKDVVDWWNAKIDDGWLDMQGKPLKNWTCHLRVWLDEMAKKHDAEKRRSQHHSSNINSGLRLRGGTLSPKILEKLKELENGIE